MAYIAVADLALRIMATEMETGVVIGGRPTTGPHLFSHVVAYANGTGASKVDAIYAAKGTSLAAAPLDLDLRGSLVSVLTGDVVSFPLITLIAVKNLSTTTGEILKIGGGSNPVTTLFSGAGDIINAVGPGGVCILDNPIDGWATTASTADILRIDPGAATIAADILILGRAS